MSKEKLSSFEKLAAVNVEAMKNKKGKYDYLSWALAWRELKKVCPDATYEVVEYEGNPFCKSEAGYFVNVGVTVDGITLHQIHPVLDNNNNPIRTPNCFQINTSIQRGLAKAIALHGLGLVLFAGEDLTQYDSPNVTQPNTQSPPTYTPNTPSSTQNSPSPTKRYAPKPASDKQKRLLTKNDVSFEDDLDVKTASGVIDLVFKGIKPFLPMSKTEDLKKWIVDQTYEPAPPSTNESEVELYAGTTSLNEAQKNMNEAVDPFELRSAPEESFKVTLEEVKIHVQKKSVEYLKENTDELQAMISLLSESDKETAQQFVATRLATDNA